MRTHPEQGVEFATQLVNDELGPVVLFVSDIKHQFYIQAVDIFMSQNMIQPATSILLDALKDNTSEQGHLQTRFLEMNLVHAPFRLPTLLLAMKCSHILTIPGMPSFARRPVSCLG